VSPNWIVLAGVLGFVQATAHSLYAILAGLNRFHEFAVISCIGSLATLGVVGAATVFAGIMTGAVAQIVVSAAVVVLLLRCATRALRQLGSAWNVRDFVRTASRLLVLGAPFYLSVVAGAISTYLVQAALVRASGPEAMAAVRVIGVFCSLITFFPTAVSGLIITHAVRKVAAGSGTNSRVLPVIWLFVVLVTPLGLAVMPLLFATIFGDAYRKYIPAANIAIVSAGILTLYSTVCSVALALRKTRDIFMISLVQAIVLLSIAIASHRLTLTEYLIAELSSHFVAFLLILWRVYGVQFFRFGERSHIALWLCTLITILLALLSGFEAISGVVGMSLSIVCLSVFSLLGWRYVLRARERLAIVRLSERLV
jgi:O-antigen/teichoic acid export membrane protein